VLVETTRALFGHLYRELGRGRPLGTALENARRELYAHPVRGERKRGTGWTDLILHDWFLPTLYRTGDDAALLAQPAAPAADNLPQVQPAGFWGRSRGLWEIERAYVAGTRRLVVCGFGGQGKTTLAHEAGRWLRATGLFERVCLVGYADFQGIDPLGWAVSSLAQVVGESLLDERAAAAALARVPTLLILDNLESLIEPAPAQSGTDRPDRSRLDALLAAAQGWSESGASRCLITTRTPDLAHPGFPTDGDRRCRYLTLTGLAPWDALAWYQSILRQSSLAPAEPPPGRDALIALFERVDFHPLSIGLLAESLKRDPIRRVAERLEALLASGDGPLVASLNLSLERLDADSSALLPRLGVFRGGTFEDGLLAVTEIAPEPWSVLRSALVSTGLIQVEPVHGVIPHSVRFHPTLAPTLWVRLGPDEQARLGERFRDYHLALARDLYQEDNKKPHATRAIARLVLPNLMAAASQSLDVGTPEMVYAAAEHWEPAERAYRAAAELDEASGNRTGAAQTWDQLAQMFQARGRPQEAEGWYRKALAVRRESADPGELGITLNNLAALLRGFPE
jgi:tetratricopeptide (TPR) repeat protein